MVITDVLDVSACCYSHLPVIPKLFRDKNKILLIAIFRYIYIAKVQCCSG